MSKLDRLLQRAIAFVKEGRGVDARSLLRTIIREEPNNLLAWRWYILSYKDIGGRIRAFDDYLSIFPQDQNAKQAQASLIRQQNAHRRQATAGAVQKTDQVKYGIVHQIKERIPAFKGNRLVIPAISLLFIFAICIGSFISITQSSNRIRTLENEYSTLDELYRSLRSEYDVLNTNFTSLDTEHNILVNDYNALVDDYGVLLGDYNTLMDEYQWLENIAVTPPYILVNGRNVNLAFNNTKGVIIYWEVSFEALEYDLQRGNYLRREIEKNPIDYVLFFTNSETGEAFYVIDFRPFVQSSYFTNVISKLYSESESDDAFIREVWNIVAQLTAYSSDLGETPRYPLETLLAGGGDCEDTAILLVSILDAAPVDWKIGFVYMDSNNPEHPIEMNHVAVYVNTGSQEYIIETTSKEVMEPFEYVSGWYVDIHE